MSNSPADNANRQAANDNQAAELAWFVMPVALQTQSDRMSNGCWVKLYSGANYDGRYMTIVGPTEVPELRSPYGTGLNNWRARLSDRMPLS